MRREKFFRLSSRRFAQVSTATLIALLLVGAARADSIEDFIISGTAKNVSGGMLGSCAAGATCSFSGTMTIDETASLVTEYDITFPGLAEFDHCCLVEGGFGSARFAVSLNSSFQGLLLYFDTGHIPESLVGFDGGAILGISNVVTAGPELPMFANFRGTITLVPEPSSLALLGTGLIGVGGIVTHKLKTCGR